MSNLVSAPSSPTQISHRRRAVTLVSLTPVAATRYYYRNGTVYGSALSQSDVPIGAVIVDEQSE